MHHGAWRWHKVGSTWANNWHKIHNSLLILCIVCISYVYYLENSWFVSTLACGLWTFFDVVHISYGMMADKRPKPVGNSVLEIIFSSVRLQVRFSKFGGSIGGYNVQSSDVCKVLMAWWHISEVLLCKRVSLRQKTTLGMSYDGFKRTICMFCNFWEIRDINILHVTLILDSVLTIVALFCHAYMVIIYVFNKINTGYFEWW